MTSKILVLETNPTEFAHWNNADYGIGAQLEAIGQDSSQVTVERIATASELLEVASEIKRSQHLPARALVFQGTSGSDLERRPIDGFLMQYKIEEPADYDENLDPIWVSRRDENRPLSPYGRLICSRLVQKALPDVRYYALGEEEENYEDVADIFHCEYAGMGYDALQPTYEGFLSRVNKHLAITGRDFMSLVNATGHQRLLQGLGAGIEGVDIDVRLPINEEALVEVSTMSHRVYTAVRQIGAVAKLITGNYPGATESYVDLSTILPRHEPSLA